MASPTQLAAKPLETATPVKPTHNNIPTEQQQPRLNCPLCQNCFFDRAQVEQHVAMVHSVNTEGQKLKIGNCRNKTSEAGYFVT